MLEIFIAVVPPRDLLIFKCGKQNVTLDFVGENIDNLSFKHIICCSELRLPYLILFTAIKIALHFMCFQKTVTTSSIVYS